MSETIHGIGLGEPGIPAHLCALGHYSDGRIVVPSELDDDTAVRLALGVTGRWVPLRAAAAAALVFHREVYEVAQALLVEPEGPVALRAAARVAREALRARVARWGVEYTQILGGHATILDRPLQPTGDDAEDNHEAMIEAFRRDSARLGETAVLQLGPDTMVDFLLAEGLDGLVAGARFLAREVEVAERLEKLAGELRRFAG